MGVLIKFAIITAVLGAISTSTQARYERVARSHRSEAQARKVKIKPDINLEDEAIYKMDLISWVTGNTVQVGNISDADLKAIVNSLKKITRPEYRKYPRIKVYNYQFESGGGDLGAESTDTTREVLVYTDPEEEKQWIVNIDDLDLRQNLIIFRLGDLGFGFSKENTFVVLRKTMNEHDIFHYFHLAYLIPRKKGKGKGYKEVEWDNIKPKDLLPIPVIYQEPKDVHATHCKSRDCDLGDVIFGTCPVVRLSCGDLKDLPLYGRDKERMDALIREQQPFFFELARSLSISNKYMEKNGKSRLRRTIDTHHSVKKDIAPASNAKQPQNSQPKISAPAKGAAPSKTLNVSVATDKNAVGASDSDHGKRLTRDQSNFHPDGVPPTSQVNKPTADSQTVLPSAENNLTANNEGGKLPTSLDPLQMEKSSDSPGNAPTTVPPLPPKDEERSYFENILEKIKNGPPAKYTVRPLECIGCDPIGTFFSEFEDTPLITYVANNLVHDIFKNTSSAVFSPEAQEVLEENKMIPYIGYGSCPYYIRTLSNLPISSELDDIIDYYTETLGVNCEQRDCDSQRSKTRMRELLTSKFHFLEIWPDMTIRLNKSSLLPRKQLLTTYEFKQFMVSLILSTYTTEYHLQLLSRAETELPTNNNQSIRMQFQTKLILRVVDELIKNFSHHLIKGARYLLQILEDKYLSLVAEHVAIVNFNFGGSENERGYFKTVNRNDRLQILALKDFLINGITSISKSRAGVLQTFTTFYKNNHERVANLLVEFGVDRRRRNNGYGNHRRSAEDYETELLKTVWIGDAIRERKEQAFITKVFVELDDEGET